MISDEHRAINAVWKSEGLDGDEKMVLYHLASKHELGERYSSSWKHITHFIKDFKDKWSPSVELEASTQLSHIKVNRAVKSLHQKGYIKLGERLPAKVVAKKYPAIHRGVSRQDTSGHLVAITDKLFLEYEKKLTNPEPS